MIKNAQFYFLSRPRRFGKSLLISTLEEYSKGIKSFLKTYGYTRQIIIGKSILL
jgi:hypothetical protein